MNNTKKIRWVEDGESLPLKESVQIKDKVNQESVSSNKEKTVNYIHIETLPSKYKLYPEGTKILARPLNVMDVKLLATMNESNGEQTINEILSRATKGIDINEILVSDKYYIIFWLRANTYRQSGYELNFFCNTCSKDSTYNFSVDVLDIKYIKDDHNEEKEIELPESKDKLIIKSKRIKDENKLNDFIKRSSQGFSKYDEEILSLASFIENVNGDKSSLYESYKYLESVISPIDFSYYVSYLDHISFGVSDEVKAICNTCREEAPLRVSFRPEFFVPKHKF